MDGLRRKLSSPGALFVFEAAARHQNFTRAAAELNVTQPAVSRALAGLEAHLGAQLFERSKPGARLTEEGKLLNEAVSHAFHVIEDALNRMEERRTGKTQITLSVSTAFTTHWLMPRMAHFRRAFPHVDLRFQLIPGPVTGKTDGVDIAMRYAMPGDPIGRFVMHEAYCPVCAPDYLARHSHKKTALIRLEGERGFEFPPLLADTSPPGDPLVFSDYSVVVQAALIGQGIATGWLNVVAYWMVNGRLVPVTPKLVLPKRQCHLIIRNDSENHHAVEAVAAWLLRELTADLEKVAALFPDLGVEQTLLP